LWVIAQEFAGRMKAIVNLIGNAAAPGEKGEFTASDISTAST
jgi:hypothetical protein